MATKNGNIFRGYYYGNGALIADVRTVGSYDTVGQCCGAMLGRTPKELINPKRGIAVGLNVDMKQHLRNDGKAVVNKINTKNGTICVGVQYVW